jgi:hypothetical protein
MCKRVAFSTGLGTAELPDGLFEARSPYEARPIRRPTVVVDAQSVNRHNARVFKASSDFGFEPEAGATVSVFVALGLDLLERHPEMEFGVERY